MATPLTDSINALTRYANETTGATDTTLSDAVETLIAGFGKGGGALWKSVTLEEDYNRNGVINFMNFLEIPSEDVLSGWVYFCEVLGNQIDTIYATRFVIFKVFEGYPDEVNALSIKKSTFNSANFGHASNVGYEISAGAIINIYRFKTDGETQQITVEDIATGFEDFGGDITINSTYIRGYAFARNWDTYDGTTMSKNATITSLYAPNCLSVGNTAFRLQSNLTKVILPECTKIESSAFAGYSMYYVMSIKELYIPKIETIGDNAFYWNAHGFEKLILPESLQTLGNYAFSQNRELKTVYFMGNNVTSIAKTCFNANPQTITDIYVPWSEGAVANAPWGASSAIIHYDTVYDSNGEPIT